MSKIEIVILVIVVGVQVVRALRKRMGGEGSESPEPISSQEEPDWEQEGRTDKAPSREERLRIPATASEHAKTQVVLPLSRPRPVQRATPVAGAALRVVSKRESLRQRLLGKVILDPPPGAAMLRRFRP